MVRYRSEEMVLRGGGRKRGRERGKRGKDSPRWRTVHLLILCSPGNGPVGVRTQSTASPARGTEPVPGDSFVPDLVFASRDSPHNSRRCPHPRRLTPPIPWPCARSRPRACSWGPCLASGPSPVQRLMPAHAQSGHAASLGRATVGLSILPSELSLGAALLRPPFWCC